MRLLLLLLFLVSSSCYAQTATEKPYKRLWLITELKLNGFHWRDLGLSKEESFKAPLEKTWKKWLSENLPNNIFDTEICYADCLTFYENWKQKKPEELNSEFLAGFKDDLFLQISIDFNKAELSEREKTFNWESRIIWLDVNTKRLLGTSIVPDKKRTWHNLDQNALNSALATAVYQAPLRAFGDFKTSITKNPKRNKVMILMVRGHQNLADVNDLSEYLETQGIQLSLIVELGGFQRNEARLLCYFSGEEKAFSDLLSQLKELKSSVSYKLVNDLTGKYPVIQLIAQ